MEEGEKISHLAPHPGVVQIINQFNPNDFIYIIKALYLNSVHPKFCDRNVFLTTASRSNNVKQNFLVFPKIVK